MSRLSDEILALLIRNAVHETRNSLFYATLNNHLSVKGFKNSANFCAKQIEEEQSHFKKVWDYIQKRNAHAILSPIPEVIGDYSDLVFAFRSALNLEYQTTEIWQEVYDKAKDTSDGITLLLAEKFLKIQESEETEFMAINDELALIGNDALYQKLWDNTYEF